METIYSPKDVAGQLEIQLSTLRKYSELLEKNPGTASIRTSVDIEVIMMAMSWRCVNLWS
ncbi:hypothetical protein GCM10020331_010500 [Ectobacillus funiculus]